MPCMLMIIQMIAIVVALALILFGLSRIALENTFKVILTVLLAIVAAIWVLMIGGLIR